MAGGRADHLVAGDAVQTQKGGIGKWVYVGWIALVAWLMAAPAVARTLVQRVDLPLSSGRVISAEIRRPADAPPVLPAVLLFGGFRGAATVLDAVPAGLSLVSASFDYPFDPPRRFEFPQSLAHLPALDRGIDQTIEGIGHLVAHLRARQDIDAQRLTIVGASLGAPFATIAAAELELPGLVIVHGFGDVRRVIAQQFIRKLAPRYGDWTRWPAWGLANALTWGFDLPAPEDYAARLRATQRVLMIVAQDDELIPQPATEALWQALQRSQAQLERLDEAGAHLQGSRDPRIGGLVETALTWMGRVGLR